MAEALEERVMLAAQTFSITGDSSVTEDASDGDDNEVDYTISRDGDLVDQETASVDVAHVLDETASGDYTTDVVAAITAAAAATAGVSFDGTTLTFTPTSGSSDTATSYPGTDGIGDTEDESWDNASNALGNSPSTFAEVELDNHDLSDEMLLTNYGFQIPTGATIDGITVTLVTTFSDNPDNPPGVQITKDGSSAVGTVPSTSDFWSSGEVEIGSSTDLWGTTWTAAEINSSNFGIIVQVEGGSNGDVFQVYTARIDVDYTVGGGAPESLDFTVEVADDSVAEGTESFSITLSNPATTASGGASISTATAGTSIVDDEIVFSISGGTSVTEDTGDGDDNEVNYTIAYSGTLLSGETATVDVAHVLNETDSSDFTTAVAAAITAAVSGATGVSFDDTTLTFSGGAGNDTSLDFTVEVAGDTDVEEDEDYSVTLSNPTTTSPSAVSIATASVDTTIVDDEIVLSISGGTSVTEYGLDADDNEVGYTIGYAGTLLSGETASVDVTHVLNETDSGDYTTAVTAAITAAVAGATGVSFDGTTLTFTGGAGNDTSLDFTVEITDDTDEELDEDYSVTLSNAATTSPSAASITTSSVDTTIVADFDPAAGNPATGDVDPTEIYLHLLPAEQATETVTLTFDPETGSEIPTADIVFVIDESGSMGGEHAWIVEMVQDLEDSLEQQGITQNRFALVGYLEEGSLFNMAPADVTVSIYEQDGTLVDTAVVPTEYEDDSSGNSAFIRAEFDLPADGVYYAVVESDVLTDQGLVSIEAEHYHDSADGAAGDSWTEADNYSASGGEQMESGPDNGTSYTSGSVSNAPRLEYDVDFAETGTYYVWLRGQEADNAGDRVHVGLGGQVVTAEGFNGFEQHLYWQESPSQLTVSSTGVQTLSLWMGEDGVQIDKIVLTRDSSFTPTGAGPTESFRGAPADPFEQNTSSLEYSFVVGDDSAAVTGATLNLNSVAAGAISPGGTGHDYTFTLSAATDLFFESLTSSAEYRWTLTGSSGDLVTGRGFDSADLLLSSVAAGTYSLAIEATENARGAYGFRLLDLTNATSLSTGTSTDSTLDPVTESNVYALSVTSGSRYYFDAESWDGDGGARWRLLDETGGVLFDARLDEDQDLVTAASTETYWLVVEGDPAETATTARTFSFTVEDVGSQASATQSLTLGTAVNDSLTQAGQREHYTFTLGSDALVYFDSLTDSSALHWTLSGPSGDVVSARAFTSGNAVVYLAAGSYTLTVDGAGDQTGSYNFNLYDVAAGASSLTPDTAESGTPDPAGETHFYEFSVTAGDKYSFDSQSWNGSSDARWKLVDPFGNVLMDEPLSDDHGTILLHAGGTYTLLIEGAEDDTGTPQYTVNVADEGSDTSDPAPLTLDQATSGEISTSAEQDEFTFTLASAGLYYFDALTDRGPVRWSLADSGGALVTNRAFSASNAAGVADADAVLDLGADTYTLTIDADTAITGDYAFRLIDLSAAAESLTTGSSVSASFDAHATRVYSFTATANDRFSLELSDWDGSTDARWRLVDDSGTVLAGDGLETGIGRVVLTAGGTYYLLLEGDLAETVQTGDVTLQVDLEAVASSATLTLGALITDTVSSAGDLLEYTFTGTAGQQVLLDFSDAATTDHFIRLRGPNGDVLFEVAHDSTNVANQITSAVLGASGDYQLLVGADNSQTGDFEFQLTVRDDVLLNGDVAGTFDHIAGREVYQFSGVEGQTVQIRMDVWGAAPDVSYAAGRLSTQGGTEDGYNAIDVALELLDFRNSASKHVILITDEDRDDYNQGLSLSGLESDLQSHGVTLHSIVNTEIDTTNQTEDALGIDGDAVDSNAFFADGQGDFTTDTSGGVTFTSAGTTNADYIDPSFDLEGTVWDLNQLRTGGSQGTSFATALSFSKAFVAILTGAIQDDFEYDLISSDTEVSFEILSETLTEDSVTYDVRFTGDGEIYVFDLEFVRQDDPTEVFGSIPVTLTTYYVRLTENSDFNTDYEYAFTIDETTEAVSIKFSDLQFDATDTDNINDAFELALVDGNGSPLVGTIRADRDAFFNITEGESADFGGGVDYDAGTGTVTVDVTHVAAGTEATLIARLVNNDDDTTTTVVVAPVAARLSTSPVSDPSTTTPLDSSGLPQTIDFDRLSDVSASMTIDYRQTSFQERDDVLYVAAELSNDGTFDVRGPLLVGVRNISDPLVTVCGADGVAPGGMPYYDVTHLMDDETFDPAETISGLMLQFYNPDQVQFDYELVVLGQLNDAPEFVSDPLLEVVAGNDYVYDADATDPDGDTLTYSLVSGPDDLSIDAQTGEITWTTTTSDVGHHPVVIRTEDPYGGSDEQSYTLAVVDNVPNRPPIFTSVPVVDAFINVTYAYQAAASDADGDDLTFSVVSGPTGLTIEDSSTGLVTWTPTDDLVDQLVSVTLKVEDGNGGEAEQDYLIYVHPEIGNHDPLIISEPDLTFEIPDLTGNPPIGDVDPDSIDLQLVAGEETTETVSLTFSELFSTDIVFVVDESSSMSDEIAWLDSAILSLNDSLSQAGINDSRFAVLGFRSDGSIFASTRHAFRVSLYGPDNELVKTIWMPDEQWATDVIADFELPAEGDYTVVVDQDTGLDPIDYRFFVEDIPLVINTAELTLDQRTSGTIDGLGELDDYTFELTSDTTVYFDSQTNTGDVHWTLVGPSGTEVVSQQAFDQSDMLIDLTAGEYTLTVDAVETYSGSYAFNLLDLATAATSLTPGTAEAGTLEPTRETDIYQFSAIVGDRFQFDSLESAGLASASWRLVDPSGNEIFDEGLADDYGPVDISAAGTYTLLIEGGINDSASSRSYSFDVVDLHNQSFYFDFGSTSSPVASTPTFAHDYSQALSTDFTDVTGTIAGGERSVGDDLERDYVYLQDATFRVPVYNGVFDVDVILGDTAGPASGHDNMQIYLEGSLVDTVTTDQAEVTTSSHTVTVSDGELTLRLYDNGGANAFVLIQGLEVVQSGSLESLSVAISDASVGETDGTAATTAVVTRTGYTTDALVVNLASDDTSEASVQTTVTIPAGSASSAPFDIDAVDDSIGDGTRTVTITASATGFYSGDDTLDVTDDEPLEYHFDFGTSSSPVASAATFTHDYTQVLYTDLTDVVGPSGSGDRSVGDDLERDYVYVQDATFRVPVPNGDFNVDVILGDTAGPASGHDNMQVYLEGSLVDTVTTDQGEVVTSSHTVNVSDGELTLRLYDDGGANAYVLIQGLDIVPTSGVETLTLAIADETIDEGDGAAATTAVVTRTGDTTDALVVYLTNLNPAAVTVPASITISAGSASSSPFDIDTVDDSTFNGLQQVTIRATADGYYAGVDTVNVTDDDGSFTGDPLTFNQTVNGSYGYGTSDEFTFTLTEAATVYFDVLSNHYEDTEDEDDTRWTLIDPEGTIVSDRWFIDSDDVSELGPGDYQLTVTRGVDGPGTYSFRLLDLDTFADSLTFGTAVSETLSPGTATDVYQFDATAGEDYFFDAETGSGTGGVRWRLLDPTNSVVFNESMDTSPGALTLASSGTYTILIEGDVEDTASSRDYTFTVHEFETTSDTLTLNQSVSDSLSTFGIDEYSFTLNDPATLYFDVLSNHGSGDPVRWSLAGPSGTIVNNRGLGASDGNDVSDANVLMELSSGTYTLTVDAPPLTSNESYSFQLLELDAVAQALTPGTAVNGALDPATEVDVYQFDADFLDRFDFDVQSWSGSSEAQWRLVDPAGNVVLSNSLSTDENDFTVSESGTYTLLIEGDVEDTATAPAYTFNVAPHDLTPTALTLDSTTSGSISSVGERDLYTFTGTAAQRVYFDWLSGDDDDIDVVVVDPSDNVIFSTTFADEQTANSIAPFDLPEAGTYRLLVGNTFDSTGAYSFRLIDVANQSALQTGAETTGQFTQYGEHDVFRFTGEEGQRLAFKISAWGSALDAVYSVDDLEPVPTGDNEDGYAGIDTALSYLEFRDYAIPQFILLTDEERDEIDLTITETSLLADLQATGADWHALLNVTLTAGDPSSQALGIDGENAADRAFFEDGSGGYTTAPVVALSTSYPPLEPGIEESYFDPVIEYGGMVWDINMISEGAPTSTSFTDALVDILTEHIGDRLQVDLVPSEIGIDYEILDESVDGDVYTFDFRLTGDGLAHSFDLQFVREENQGVVLGSIPVTIQSGYLYDVNAIDPDEDPLTYTLVGETHGADVDDETGLLRWTPTSPGDYEFTAQVTDGRGGHDEQTWTVSVSTTGSGNNDPVLSSVDPLTIEAEREFAFAIEATDADGDPVFYQLVDDPPGGTPLPDGMTIDAFTGVISWTPTVPQIDTYDIAVRAVDDRGGLDSMTISIEVVEPVGYGNTSPVITSTAPTDADAGELYFYDVTATDDDNDPLVYDLPIKPDGMAISPSTGRIAWLPTDGDVGTHTVIVRVRDGQGAVGLQAYDLEVTLPDNAPTITSAPTTVTDVDELYNYQVTADDPNPGDTLTFALFEPPTGMTINSTSGLVSWTPDTVEINTVTVIVSDQDGNTDTQVYQLAVVDPALNNDPTITSTPRDTIQAGRQLIHQFTATDADGDNLTFSLVSGPTGMTVDADGLLLWTPDAGDVTDPGSPHSYTVRVDDGRGSTEDAPFSINVVQQPVNSAPVITSTPPLDGVFSVPYTYQAEATDADNDLVVWSLIDPPDGMTIDAETGLVEWPLPYPVADHDVQIQVTDPYGGLDLQEFELSVRGSNIGPIITSTPSVEARLNTAYTYDVEAYDPDGDSLTYALVSPPSGMTIDDETGVIDWTPASTGTTAITVRVTDEFGFSTDQIYGLLVHDTSVNLPPTIDSTPGFVAVIDQDYEYQVDASDPNNDTLTYALTDNPSGMTIGLSSGLIEWTPNTGDEGQHFVRLTVSDGQYTVSQWYTLLARDNTAPAIQTIADQTIAAGARFRLDVNASDSEGDPLTYELTDNPPAGMTIDQFGRITWQTSTADIATHSVEVTVTDSLGASATESFDLTVAADTTDPLVTIIASSDPAVLDTDVIILVLASDNVGVESLELTVDGTLILLDSSGRATLTIDSLDTRALAATATDAAGNTGTANHNLTVIDPSDVNEPVVSLSEPDEGDTLTVPTDVVGSIDDPDDNLVSWTLTISGQGHDDLVIGSGTTELTDGTLGQIDTTLLANGLYTLTLTAVDSGGNTVSTSRSLHVDGNLKLGNFNLSFVDLEVPVAGFPIIVSRSYDTLRSHAPGEVGYGWRLDISDTEIEVDLPYDDLAGYGSNAPFRDGTRVVVTLPGGSTEGFTFYGRPGTVFGSAIFDWFPTFIPDPGVTSELIVSQTSLQKVDDEYVDLETGLAYNPAHPLFGNAYNLVTKSGLTLAINATTGRLASITDRNGNTLYYTGDGITSDSGRGIEFERDYLGRITSVIDPAGYSVDYEYDSAGNLISVTDRLGATTQFTYLTDPEHYLDKIIDPLGRTSAELSYDTDGRLDSVIDAIGATVDYEYDVHHRLLTSYGQLNGTSTLTFDDFGNLIEELDPNQNLTLRTYSPGTDFMTSETRVIGLLDNPANGETDDLTFTYTYDSNGNVLTKTDPAGHVTRLEHASDGRLLAEIDPLGNTRTYSYDTLTTPTATFSQLSRVTDEKGLSIAVNYDSRGNITSLTAGDQPPDTYSFNSYGDRVSTTDPYGITETFTYDSVGNQISSQKTWVNPNNPTDTQLITVSMTYDANGRLIEREGPEGTETVEYDAIGRPVRTVDTFGGVTELLYDVRGNLIETKFPDGTIARLIYDAKGRVTYEQDPHHPGQASGGSLTQHDAVDRVVSIERFGDLQIDLQQLADGSWTTVLADTPSATLGTKTTTFDDAGRVIQTSDLAGLVTSYEYNRSGGITAVVLDPNGQSRRTEYEYDDAGRRVSMRDPLGNETRFEYNAAGQITKTLHADGTSTETTYDTFGHITSQRDQSGYTTNYEHDPQGNLTAVILPETDDPESGMRIRPTTEYEYDQYGNLVTIRDPNGRDRTFVYDSLNRNIQETLPALSGQSPLTEYRTYTSLGQLHTVVDFRGQVTEFVYDTTNRIEKQRFYADIDDFNAAVVSQSIDYTYDQFHVDGMRYDTIVTPDGTTEYTYDVHGRTIRVSSAEGVVNYEYDAGIAPPSRVFTDNTDVSYEFDELRQLVSVSVAMLEGVVLGTPEITTYSYDVAGNLLEMNLPNNTTTTFTYDALNRPTYIHHADPSDETLSSFYYFHDARGYTIAVWEDVELSEVQQLLDTGGLPAVRRDFQYDELGRLISESHYGSPNSQSYSYSYDLVGNRLAQEVTFEDNTFEETNYSYNALDQLFSETSELFEDMTKATLLSTDTIEYEYDANGNLITRIDDSVDAVYYEWDFQNRLVAVDTDVDGTNDIVYEYSPDGNRVAQIVDGVETRYLLDVNRPHAEVLEEYDDVGNLDRSYVYGLARIYQSVAGTRAFYHADDLGSVRALTDTSGAQTDTFVYSAFGETLASTGTMPNNNLFAGQRLDVQTGFYDLRARQMDPATGRFVSRDPFSGWLEQPISLHKYVYAADNPLYFVDPSGMVVVPAIIASAFIRSNAKWGQRVHDEVGFDFLRQPAVAGLNYYDETILTILGVDWAGPAGATRPDLTSVLPGMGSVYEIKPQEQWVIGVAQLQGYLWSLNTYDPLQRPWTHGATYVPPSYVALSGNAFAWVAPPKLDGVILYAVLDMSIIGETFVALVVYQAYTYTTIATLNSMPRLAFAL